jgi:hypothetical protein
MINQFGHFAPLNVLDRKSAKSCKILLLNDLKNNSDKREVFFDLSLARYVLKFKKDSTLLAGGKRERTKNFLTGRFDYSAMAKTDYALKMFDSASLDGKKQFSNYTYSLGEKDYFLEELKERYSNFSNYFKDLIGGSLQGPSLARAWNISIVSAVIFGMVTMTFIYRYLGESVSAKISEEKEKTAVQAESKRGQVLGAENYATDDAEVEFITKLIETYDKNGKENALEKEIQTMVKGYPIESMVPEIAKQDRIVAAFLVAIAKKESSWGVHVPVYQGQDCYNYWGWRGKNPVGSGGHTCFDSPEDAISTVAKRIAILIDEYGRNTPEKMVVWKCGSDCEATGGQAAANKWISDVNLYFKKLNKQG